MSLVKSIGPIGTWQDSFGWIKPDVTIDHKDAGRREGKIFVPWRGRH